MRPAERQGAPHPWPLASYRPVAPDVLLRPARWVCDPGVALCNSMRQSVRQPPSSRLAAAREVSAVRRSGCGQVPLQSACGQVGPDAWSGGGSDDAFLRVGFRGTRDHVQDPPVLRRSLTEAAGHGDPLPRSLTTLPLRCPRGVLEQHHRADGMPPRLRCGGGQHITCANSLSSCMTQRSSPERVSATTARQGIWTDTARHTSSTTSFSMVRHGGSCWPFAPQ